MQMTQIFLQVLKMSLISALVITVVIAMRFALKRMPKIFSYLLWGVVLFRLLCPVSFTSPVSLLGVLGRAEMSDLIAADLSQETGAPNAVRYVNAQFENNLIPGEPVFMEQPDSVTAADDASTVRTQSRAELLLRGLTLVWLAGIAVMILQSVISALRLRRRIAGATQIGENVYETSEISVPFVFGIIRPRIYLPVGLTDAERDYIVLHERTHIERQDHIVKIAAFLSLALHWFNPLVWVAFRLAEKDMEMSCDEAVLRKSKEDIRAAYSQSLLGLATGRQIISGMPLAFGEGDTKDRVKHVMLYQKPALIMTAATILLVTALGIVLISDPQNVTAEEPELTNSQDAAESKPGLTDLQNTTIGEPGVTNPQGLVLEKTTGTTDETREQEEQRTKAEKQTAAAEKAAGLAAQQAKYEDEMQLYNDQQKALKELEAGLDAAKVQAEERLQAAQQAKYENEKDAMNVSMAEVGLDVYENEMQLYNDQQKAAQKLEADLVAAKAQAEKRLQEVREAEQETTFMAYIKGVHLGKLVLDPVEWVQVPSKRADELGITEDDAPSGFYLYKEGGANGGKSAAPALEYAVQKDCAITILDQKNNNRPVEQKKSEFVKTTLQDREQLSDTIPYRITVKNGEIIDITEQYVP